MMQDCAMLRCWKDLILVRTKSPHRHRRRAAIENNFAGFDTSCKDLIRGRGLHAMLGRREKGGGREITENC